MGTIRRFSQTKGRNGEVEVDLKNKRQAPSRWCGIGFAIAELRPREALREQISWEWLN